MLLAARDLRVSPPGTPDEVVRGVSLEVAAGEWVALTGDNGCGKTSLVLGLAGLWATRGGSVAFEDRPFGPHAPAAGRAAMAVVLQDPAGQLLQRTVLEEVGFAALNLDHDAREVAEQSRRWLSRLGLEDEAERDPRRLSAGRQQLVLLAGALVAQPRLLIADEATAHLDPAIRGTLLGMLREEVRRGLGILWVTQDPTELAAADRVVALPPSSMTPATSSAGSEAPGFHAPLLTLEVDPWDGSEGPAFRGRAGFALEVASRGITAVEGRNGVGKSVLLGCAAGLIEVPQIRVRWHVPAAGPAIIATQFPEQQLFEERVADELVYAAVSRGVPRVAALESASAALAALGLEPHRFLGRRVWSLSGGEKRLVALASALIAPASLIVLDEPTAGLDGIRKEALAGILTRTSTRTPLLIASQEHSWLRSLRARITSVGGQSGVEPSPTHGLPGGASHGSSASKKTD
jgi:energy-coupling factor transport system ATP-binding protein